MAKRGGASKALHGYLILHRTQAPDEIAVPNAGTSVHNIRQSVPSHMARAILPDPVMNVASSTAHAPARPRYHVAPDGCHPMMGTIGGEAPLPVLS